MEELCFSRFDGIGSAIRKKRSQTSRRPKTDSQSFADSHDHSSLSTTPPSDDASKASSDELADTNSRRKEFNLNQCLSRVSSASGAESEKACVRNNEAGVFNGGSAITNKRSREGVLAPANWKSTSKVKECLDLDSGSASIYAGTNGKIQGSERLGVVSDAVGSGNKVKKVKLKVGGFTRTIHANSSTNGASSMKNPQSSDTSRTRQIYSFQGNLEEEHAISDKRTGLQGVPWKDFSSGGFGLGKEDSSMGKMFGKNTFGKHGDKSEPVRKSKRVPKRRVLDGEFDENDEDDEIRYLEKLKLTSGYKEDDDGSSKKLRKLSTMENIGALKLAKDGKTSRSDRALEDTDYEEEEELPSDGELEGNKKKKQKKESVNLLMDGKRQMTLTTRQRALKSSKDGSSEPGGSLIEFPNGLPPAPSRKQKEKLTEVEQQLKKAEAAQRRRMQVEKAARDSEAEAIRKILGQDSSRKKREEKIKKRQEELAQEKAANALKLASNTVRWVSGLTGTVVTFSEDMGLPSIFDSKLCSYPPPREKCAGPSCTNPFKYRDSKSNLPLCSLQCYKAIREQMPAETSI